MKALWRWQKLNGVGRWWREKQRKRKGEDDGDTGLITRLRSKKKPRHGLHRASAMLRTATRAPGTEKKATVDEVASTALFPIFIESPFAKIFKLLPNLCNNSKISKNKSWSKFKVLQLCFYNHPLMRSTFWNASLNSKRGHLKNFTFSNTSIFMKQLWKLQKPTLYNSTSSTLLLLGPTLKCA